MTGLLALPLAVLLLCHGRYSHADASKRAALKQEIESLLTGIASELRDVPSDSGTSALERTVDHAGRVAEKARDLKYVARTTRTPGASATTIRTSRDVTETQPATCAR